MKLTIKNYKNILSGEIELEEGKLNVLFGVSGIGKSSIAESLDPTTHEHNKSYLARSGDAASFIDGFVPLKTDTISFSSDRRIMIREVAAEEHGYELLVDDDGELQKAESELGVLLDEFYLHKPDWDQQIGALRELNKAMKNKLVGKRKDELHKSSLLRVFLDACEADARSTSVVREIMRIGTSKANWINDGFDYIKADSATQQQYCPYCNKVMGSSLKRRAVRLHSFAVESIVGLEAKPAATTEFGNPVSMANDRDAVVAKAIGLVKVVEEYDALCLVIEDIKNGVLPPNSRSLQKSFPHLYERYPEIFTAVDGIFAQYGLTRRTLSRVRKAAAAAVSRKLRFVNNHLERFGIPYVVHYEIRNHQIVGARITHKSNGAAIDDAERLSEGEKTIVAFILFAIRASKSPNAKLIVLDDPISNFNNERRLDFLSLVQSTLNNRTVLLLTCDQAFIKISLNHRGLKTVAQFVRNENGTLMCKPITNDDFVQVDSAALEACLRCQDSPYLRKIANLRYFYELKQHDGRPRSPDEVAPRRVYGYLSQVLHGLTLNQEEFTNELIAKLRDLCLEEAKIIGQIELDTKLVLPPADYHSLRSCNLGEDFEFWLEKAIVIRLSPLASVPLKNAINNFVHLNSTLAVCLNPFEFETCSSFVSERLVQLSGPIDDLFPLSKKRKPSLISSTE